MSLFSGFNRPSTVPAGSLAKASLVGANTVNGPGPESVSTRPAAFTAATSVVWSFEFTAFWMMFLDGYIAAPPTVTVFSFICARTGAAGATAAAKAIRAAEANKAKCLDIGVSICDWHRGGEPACETDIEVVVGNRYGGLPR